MQVLEIFLCWIPHGWETKQFMNTDQEQRKQNRQDIEYGRKGRKCNKRTARKHSKLAVEVTVALLSPRRRERGLRQCACPSVCNTVCVRPVPVPLDQNLPLIHMIGNFRDFISREQNTFGSWNVVCEGLSASQISMIFLKPEIQTRKAPSGDPAFQTPTHPH